MKQVFAKTGSVFVDDVPAPRVEPGTLLVKVLHSCVSVGTESAGVRSTGQSLYRRAVRQPEKMVKVLQMAREKGVRNTARFVSNQTTAAYPMGYSAAGIVAEVGKSVEGFSVGDLVACAGAKYAVHAEYVNVPVNLAVKIPEGIGSQEAATVTLGAIAMQGVRRTAPTIGETIVVVGLGLLGQIATQIFVANGCRVIAVDIDGDRVRLAVENGAKFGIDFKSADYVDRVNSLTDGFGADAVVITAASASNDIVSQAMNTCRKKGRVVLVGDVGLNLKREDFYTKELDFLISTSYGPGRYDPIYEEGGQDYPLPYVRWTENRNMAAYLQLIADETVSYTHLTLPTICSV